MSRFHLHARLFAPTRNELRTAEADDPGELRPLAEELAGQGFRVWLFEHDHRPDAVRPVPVAHPEYALTGPVGTPLASAKCGEPVSI